MTTTLSQYLKLVSTIRHTGAYASHKRFVIGNSSVDYDSFFGSIVYSYIKYLLLQTVYIPLIDCPRSELSSRFEIVQIMKKLHIDPQMLFYSEDYNHQYPVDSEFCLYDHNVRQVPSVVEIVDHHHLTNTTCKNILVTHSGSAMSLLYFWLNYDQIPEQHPFVSLYNKFGVTSGIPGYDATVDEIIYYGILIDSFNFNPKQSHRWIELEKLAVNNIKLKLQAASTPLLSFQEIEEAKFSQSMNLALSLPQILKKDYKQFSYSEFKLAFSIILLPPEVFVSHYGSYLDFVKQECHKNHIDGYFLMYLYSKGASDKKTRELMFWTDQPKLEGLLKDTLLKMGMQNKEGASKEVWSYFDPSGIISRKILQKQLSLALNY